MKASVVRGRVLADHRDIRAMIEALEDRASEVLKGAPDDGDALRSAGELLLTRLIAHMHWEEAHLIPALREADAWGNERATRLHDEHVEQWELLQNSLERLGDPARPTELLAQNLLDLTSILREDMLDEEENLLDDEILRDDIVAIRVEIG